MPYLVRAVRDLNHQHAVQAHQGEHGREDGEPGCEETTACVRWPSAN
jgi:hypothetical protein